MSVYFEISAGPGVFFSCISSAIETVSLWLCHAELDELTMWATGSLREHRSATSRICLAIGNIS